ncbi:hypothetical protein [Streptomyces sp. NPDC045714]
MRPQILSLSETVNSVLPSVVNTTEAAGHSFRDANKRSESRPK